MNRHHPILSFCVTCRDGHEADRGDVRAGMRLAQAFLSHIATVQHRAVGLRGVRCMSQCRRPCIVTLSASGRFTYMFGDLDAAGPDHVKALSDLIPLYLSAPEGFLLREARPEPLRARILGRLPPPGSSSDLIIRREAMCPHAPCEPECNDLANCPTGVILPPGGIAGVEQTRDPRTASPQRSRTLSATPARGK